MAVAAVEVAVVAVAGAIAAAAEALLGMLVVYASSYPLS